MPAPSPPRSPKAPADAYDDVLTREAREFVAELTRRFQWRIEKLLEQRRARQARFDAGERPRFLSETAHLRAAAWTVGPIPGDLLDRRVEITGPVDRKSIIDGLNSGASVFLADFEDSNSPTRDNVLEGQRNVRDAVRRDIHYTAPDTGRSYRLQEKTAVLMIRPRGLHLPERHFLVDGKPVPGSLFDFGLWFFHNARELVARGSGPYLYLPKLEHFEEARLWNDAFLFAQQTLGIPRGTVRATVLIETLPAAFQMDEILWELREHSAGLTCGRWNYISSFIKNFRNDADRVLPDRGQVTMDKGFLRAYAELLVQTCHRRAAHAMGGMAAQIPIEDDPAANDAALAKVRADKLREVKDGHDGTWVAHPGLVPVTRAVFDEHMPAPNQIDRRREDVKVSEADLLAPAPGTRTEAGLRHNVRVGVQYLESWLRGVGCVPICHLMEDAATAEISRAQVWQWLRHGIALGGGRRVTRELFLALVDEEMERIRGEVGEEAFAAGRFPEARDLYVRGSTSSAFDEFLAVPAYALLDGDGPAAVADLVPPRPPSPWPEHSDPRRWEGVRRSYEPAQVERLRGSVRIEHTLARLGAERLWELLHTRPYVHSLGALSGQQAVQMVKAGLEAIYLSGWQVAADANTAGQTYPDQSLYPADSVPAVVRRINRAFARADQIAQAEGKAGTRWFAPIVADAEAGFGGPLNAFELMKAMIEAGAAAVHFEDQVAAEKKCGHLGGKVLVPTSQFLRTLNAARLAADVLGVPTLLVARTDADSAKLVMSDVDPYDAPFIDRSKGRTPEGFYHLRGGVKTAVARGQAYAPYADLVWCETSTPDLEEAREFAEGIHSRYPGKMLAYNCSPSFNWKKNLDDATIARFQRELGAMGYKYQFVTLAGFHALNYSMYQLASEYRLRGMQAYTELQVAEFGAESRGYTATRHQAEVGTGYFDQVAEVLSAGQSSTLALGESTEATQFQAEDAGPRAKRLVEEGHERLHDLARRMRQSGDPAALAAVLEELDRALVEHFAHEEHPQGLLALLSAKAPAERQRFAEVLDEHEGILSRVRGLGDEARRGHTEPAVLSAQAAMLAHVLGDHERRESQVTEAVLGPAEVALA